MLDGNEQGDFENIIFSYANIADCKIAEKLAEVVKGTIFADAGYLQKKDVLKRMEEKGIKSEVAPEYSASLRPYFRIR
ncbi:MAG: transposase [Treponema sp.]|nr:transposase [Treponema sp.]